MSFDLTKLVGFNFNGLEVSSVDIATAANGGGTLAYVPGSTIYNILPSGFVGNNTDNGFGETNTFEQVTAASNGTQIDGSALTNPLAVGQIVYNDVVNGAPSPSATYDVLGYSADGSSLLVALASSYNANSSTDPYNGAYNIISDQNIDGNATPTSLFPTSTQTFSPSNSYIGGPVSSGGVAADLVTVTNALAGMSLPANAIVSIISGSGGVIQNADGSYTALQTSATLVTGKGTLTALPNAATGAEGQATLKFAAAGGTTYFQVVGFNSTQILLEAVTSTGAAQGTPRYFILSIKNPPAENSVKNINFANYGTAPIYGVAYPCFLAGTYVTTMRGEVRVEHLTDGDLVKTHLAGFAPVIWLGRSPFDARRHPHPELVWPIRIRAGALADGVPRADLLVSPGHSLLLDGQLVQAGKLVNGATIVQDTSISRGTYFHIEVPKHDVLWSEGALSETYLDTGNRSAFANSGGVVDLHPDYRPRHPTETCLPLVEDAATLTALHGRLRERALALGWQLVQTREPTVVAAGKTLRPMIRDGGFFVFEIPPGAETLRIRSASAIPKHMLADSADERRIGLAVSRITLINRGRVVRDVKLDSAALLDGWHAVERAGTRAWRWTNGDSGLAVGDAAWMELTVDSAQPQWAAPAAPASRVWGHAAGA